MAVVGEQRVVGRRDRLPQLVRGIRVPAQAAEHASVAQAGLNMVWLFLQRAPEERLGLPQLVAYRGDAERHPGR